MKFYIKYAHGAIMKEATIEASCGGDALRKFAEIKERSMQIVQLIPISEFQGNTTKLLPFGWEGLSEKNN